MQEVNGSLRSGRYYFGLTKRELGFLIFLFVLSTFLFVLAFEPRSIWMAAGLVFSGFVLVHIVLTNSRYIVVPGFACLIACVQWIVAPWLSYRYPPYMPGLFFARMAVPPESYFAYAVPATLALWLGLHLPLWNIKKDKIISWLNISWRTPPLTGPQKLLIDLMIGLGLILSFGSSYLPGQISFICYSFANLRFVGILCWMLTRTRGWVWRTGFIFSILLAQLATEGVFYQLILWTIYLFIAIAYVRKWNWKFLPLLMAGVILLILFNNAKTAYRLEAEAKGLSDQEKIAFLGQLFLDSLDSKKGLPEAIEERGIGDILVRYNQGWIIARVMALVPGRQPYAEGETVIAAFKDSLVPRFLFPRKFSLSSKEFFEKYTEHNPGKATMALGISGEMYANFGKGGGIFATFLYAFFIGYIFFKFVRLAQNHILWLAWVPFVLLPAFEAEWNLVDILNSIVKSSLIMAFVVCASPFFRSRLLRKRKIPAGMPSVAMEKLPK